MIDPRNYFAPQIGPPGLRCVVEAGFILVNGSSVFIPLTLVPLIASTQNYVYINTSTAAIITNTSGFPATNCYPVANVITTASGISSLVDARPDVTGAGGGGGGGAVSSVFTRTGAVVAANGDYTVDQVTGAAPLDSPAFTTGISVENTISSPGPLNIEAGSGHLALVDSAGANVILNGNTITLDNGGGGTSALVVDAVNNVTIAGATVELTANSSVAIQGPLLSVSSPTNFANSINLAGALFDGSSLAGGSGQILSSTGTSTLWIPAPAASTVSSVFGRTGAILALSGDYTVAKITGAAPLASPTFTGTAAFTNITVSGTTSFAAGSIAYAALSGTPTIPTSFPWNTNTDATGNLTLANAAFTSTFNQTSAAAWLWANTTAATNLGVNQNSPSLNLAGTYFTLGASAADTWSFQNALATAHTSSTVSNVAETAGSVVTLTITGGTFVAGDVATFTSLTQAAWLNGTNQTLTAATATTLTFTDSTAHGLLNSIACTGQATQANPQSLLTISHTGSAGGGSAIITVPPTAAQTLPSITSSANTGVGINIGALGSQPLTTLNLTGNQLDLQCYAGATQAFYISHFSTTAAVNLVAASGVYPYLNIMSGVSPTAAGAPSIILGCNATPRTAVTGTQIGVSHGSTESASGNFYGQLIFQPTSGTAAWIPSRVVSTINQAILSTAVTAATITTASAAALTVTLSTGFTVGASIKVAGLVNANNTQLNGTWTVASISAGIVNISSAAAWTTHTISSGEAGTVKQQASGSYTGLLVNAIETAVGGTANKLLDLQAGTTGGTSRFSVDNAGALFTASVTAPTSAGTAGTAGQIISGGTFLYFCSVTGVAGAATWNKLTMASV